MRKTGKSGVVQFYETDTHTVQNHTFPSEKSPTVTTGEKNDDGAANLKASLTDTLPKAAHPTNKALTGR